MIAFLEAFALFAAAFVLVLAFRMPAQARRAMAISRAAAAGLRDPALDERAKERLAQKSSIELSILFFGITLGVAGAVAAPLAVLWLLDQLRLASLRAVTEIAMSPLFLVACTVAAMAYGAVTKRLSRSAP